MFIGKRPNNLIYLQNNSNSDSGNSRNSSNNNSNSGDNINCEDSNNSKIDNISKQTSNDDNLISNVNKNLFDVKKNEYFENKKNEIYSYFQNVNKKIKIFVNSANIIFIGTKVLYENINNEEVYIYIFLFDIDKKMIKKISNDKITLELPIKRKGKMLIMSINFDLSISVISDIIDCDYRLIQK